MKKLLLFAAAALCFAAASGRGVYDISRNWKFYEASERDSVSVDLPHTWNAVDVADGDDDYRRGTGNYFRSLTARPEWAGRRVFVRFYGAGTVADLSVNGRYVGQHRGGSNAFEFEITDYLDYGGRNLLWVMVGNAARTDVLPTAGEECVGGGLFRRAEIIVTDRTAVGFDGTGGDGVLVRALSVDRNAVSGRAAVSVNSLTPRTVQIEMKIRDDRDSVVFDDHIRFRADKGVSQAEIPFSVASPRLWDGVGAPALYGVTVTLADGDARDSVSVVTGFRRVEVDAAGGFRLNGRRYPLRGVVLWRDRAGCGAAMAPEQIAEDLDIICGMGANAVRVAGGSHSPEFYSECDRRGIVVVTDLPFSGAVALGTKGFYDTPAFRENAVAQLRETVAQRYNNPSVAAWCLFSEPELVGESPVQFIGALHAEAHRLDPTRPTVGVSNKDGDVNRRTDLIIWNHVFGWRTGMPDDIAVWRDQLHGDPEWSKVASAVSYRAAGDCGQYDERLRMPDPARGFHPENWQTHVHAAHIRALAADSLLWGVFVGDMFDHAAVRDAAGRHPGVNDCGLVTRDRAVLKDAYWLYKANWNTADPFVRIADKRHGMRCDSTQTVTVFTNQPSAELFVDGVSCGIRPAEFGAAVWSVTVRPGVNILRAVAVTPSGDDYLTLEDEDEIVYDPAGKL